MAVPRLAPHSGDGVVLPQPLAAADAALLRRLFGAPRLPITSVLREAAALDQSVRLNHDMIGYLLAGHYLQPGFRASAAELSAWLTDYAPLPESGAIARLLQRRDPKAASGGPLLAASPPFVPVPEEDGPPGARARRNSTIARMVRARLRGGQIAAAQRLVEKTRGLSPEDGAVLRAEIAQALFTANRDQDAAAFATSAVPKDRSGLAAYIAGLSAWRLGHHALALRYFAVSADAPLGSPSIHAAGAYWAARACIATGDHERWRGWLEKSAGQRRTFYGLIAARMLGRFDGLDFTEGVLGEADIEAISAEAGGLRAFALLQIGQVARAEAELRALAAQKPHLARPVMLVAERAGMFAAAADLAATIEQSGGQELDADRFPVPHLDPRNGFLMDPALVYALARVESNFDAAAVSPAGAHGLMQLMPATASAIAHRAARLNDPAENLDIGQRYLASLGAAGGIDGDLIRLLASYNAGPGALGAWGDQIRDFGDPLLFIEAIPVEETRIFVQRTLAYTWIYAARLHLAAPSLDALATGRYPRFSAETPRVELAVLH